MNWFVWRQHRKQFMIFGMLLAVIAALLIPTGVHFWHAYQHAHATCVKNPDTLSCANLADSIFGSQIDGAILSAVVLGSFAAPLLVGIFVGAPLIAKEYDEGTNKLVWTQSTSRRKWLTAKLAWAIAFAALYGLAVTLLVTWWSRTSNVLHLNRFVQGHFETQGLMPVALAVFFTSIGAVMGAWFHKALVALAITFGVFVLCMALLTQLIRPHYMTPVTVTAPMGPATLDEKLPKDAIWLLSQTIVDKNGKSFDPYTPENMPANCQQLLAQARGSANGAHKQAAGDAARLLDNCLTNAGYHQIAKYQPAYRYWDFQRIEAGIYLGLAAVAIGATYWLVLRRDA